MLKFNCVNSKSKIFECTVIFLCGKEEKMEKINLIDLQKRKLDKCYLALMFFTEDIKTRNEGCFSLRKLYVLLGTDINGNRKVIGT